MASPYTILSALLLLFTFTVSGFAQFFWFGSPEAILAGSSSRAWTLVRTEGYLANFPMCSRPVVYRFYRDGRLTTEECVKDQLITSSRQWQLASRNTVDALIKIDDVTYTFRIKSDKENPGKMRLILRSPSISIILPVLDQEFLQSE